MSENIDPAQSAVTSAYLKEPGRQNEPFYWQDNSLSFAGVINERWAEMWNLRRPLIESDKSLTNTDKHSISLLSAIKILINPLLSQFARLKTRQTRTWSLTLIIINILTANPLATPTLLYQSVHRNVNNMYLPVLYQRSDVHILFITELDLDPCNHSGCDNPL